MAYCSNCGAKLEENAKFCLACGTPVEQTETTDAPVADATPAPAKASGNLNVAQLVWSIINLILCCMPLGIAGLILTIFAKDAPSAEEEAKKLKTAKTCNLIGSIGGGLWVIISFVISVLAGLAEVL